jgi:hypothetical protein
MKFWELVSVCRSDKDILERMAEVPEGITFLNWYRDFGDLVRRQDRQKLDQELPDVVSRHVLEANNVRYRVERGLIIRARSEPPGEFSAVEIFDRYGGSVLEEVQEYGSAEAVPV